MQRPYLQIEACMSVHRCFSQWQCQPKQFLDGYISSSTAALEAVLWMQPENCVEKNDVEYSSVISVPWSCLSQYYMHKHMASYVQLSSSKETEQEKYRVTVLLL